MEKLPHLNILYVGTLPPHQGGSAISCSQLLIGFAKLGHTVRAVAPITNEALESGDAFALRYPDLRVTRFAVPYFETNPNVPASDDYRRSQGEHIARLVPSLIEEERPDCVYIGRETFARDVADIAKQFGLPSLMRIAGGTTLGILNGTYPPDLSRQILEQYRKVDLLVSPAKHMAKRLRELGFANCQAIPNAANLDQFSPQPKRKALLRELGFRDEDIVVAHISNLKAMKRPMDIVESAERALRENAKLVYLIVGDGPCRQGMEEACKRRHIAEKFRFVGWVEYEGVADYVNLADMVVMPAEDETLARVYIETQACARVLLASDIPAAREVITDGETGLLFGMGDIDDLTAKTLLAGGDATLRAAIGRNARDRVSAHGLDQALAAHVAAFRNIIQSHV